MASKYEEAALQLLEAHASAGGSASEMHALRRRIAEALAYAERHAAERIVYHIAVRREVDLSDLDIEAVLAGKV